MNTEIVSKAKRLLDCIGGVSDLLVEEAESAGVSSGGTVRGRLVRYGTLAAAASVGIAVTVLVIRSKRAAQGRACEAESMDAEVAVKIA